MTFWRVYNRQQIVHNIRYTHNLKSKANFKTPLQLHTYIVLIYNRFQHQKVKNKQLPIQRIHSIVTLLFILKIFFSCFVLLKK